MQDIWDWVNKTGLDRILWATDLDLTVLDAAPDPSKVTAPPEVEAACQEIDRLTHGRFYIITGRELDYVDRVFPNTPFKVSAEYHNMARFDAAGIQDLNPRPQWALIDAAIDAIVAVNHGMVVRKKPFMRSIHYTHAPGLKDFNVKAQVQQQLQALLDHLAQKTGQVVEIKDGGSVFDIGPAGADKGVAFADIYSRVSGAPVPVYFGDSPGDIPAAQFAKSKGGVFVAVGHDPRVLALADFTLDDPAACRAFLMKASGVTPGRFPVSSITPKSP
ncbi:MAG: HAD-IIB family hydrolase [Micavibrio aeruginosavorus]|uniref:HAD-IIB family hydrolase n=1 Tax=Micavibrio aeruginosavorus TaxID=349221 RepID=A0A7T5R096_9BACT|nr:MAG: HAD-IIB family hydrolase [Micavibrio aeruginosavorus]